MLSGSFCLKKGNKLVVTFENLSAKVFNNKLEKFTTKKKRLLNFKKVNKSSSLLNEKLKKIKIKISKNNSKINHKILISNETQKNNKICIDLKKNTVEFYNKDKLPYNCHYFIVEDNEFNQWFNNKISFEEVLGTRRFRYQRYPNIYNVKINQIYTNYL